MIFVSIKNIFNEEVSLNSHININGWVKSRRNSKMGYSFIDLYDGSHMQSLQVITNASLKNYHTEILHVTTGCSIVVSGILILSKGNKQKYEILAHKFKIIGWIKDPSKYPISSKKHTFEYLRAVSHLRSRTNTFGAITRIRNSISYCIHKFFYLKDFLWVPTPIITTLNAEGAGNMFSVSTLDNPINDSNYKKSFFGKQTFLTVSGQLTLETYACALSKVYTFGPVFRAESSNTTRHLSEFWMLEVEKTFCNLDEIIFLAESMLKMIVKNTLKKCFLEIDFLEKNVDSTLSKRLFQLVEKKFNQIEYTEAIDILKNSKIKFKNPIFWGIDFSTEHERYLSEKYFKNPVIIKNYPKELKAFYMRLNKDNKTVAAMDMLFPQVGELLGGSEREDRLEILDNRLLECKLQSQDYWWYRDLRKFGTVPHSGFGLGFERLLCYITGLNNVRDVIPYPRTVQNSCF